MKNGGIANIPDPAVRLAEQVRVLAEEQHKRDEEQKRKEEEQKRKEEEKDRELAELRAMIKEIMSRPAVVNVNTGPVTNNNITINTYDKPNYQHLMGEAARPLVRGFIEKHLMAFPLELVAPLWFNTGHPENHSVIVDPKKPSVCKVLGECGWELRDTAESANELKHAASDVARKLVREHAPDIFGLAAGIEDRKYAQGPGAQQDNAAIVRKMILGSQLITGAITGVK